MNIDGDVDVLRRARRLVGRFNGGVDEHRRRPEADGRERGVLACFNGAVDEHRRRRPRLPGGRVLRRASMEPSMNIDGDGGALDQRRNGHVASMEPSMNIDGDVEDGRRRGWAAAASMEPSRNIDGDVEPLACGAHDGIASMKPSMNIDGFGGRRWTTMATRRASPCFNGAVDEHRRRPVAAAIGRLLEQLLQRSRR